MVWYPSDLRILCYTIPYPELQEWLTILTEQCFCKWMDRKLYYNSCDTGLPHGPTKKIYQGGNQKLLIEIDHTMQWPKTNSKRQHLDDKAQHRELKT